MATGTSAWATVEPVKGRGWRLVQGYAHGAFGFWYFVFAAGRPPPAFDSDLGRPCRWSAAASRSAYGQAFQAYDCFFNLFTFLA
jgi:hypothetical protein